MENNGLHFREVVVTIKAGGRARAIEVLGCQHCVLRQGMSAGMGIADGSAGPARDRGRCGTLGRARFVNRRRESDYRYPTGSAFGADSALVHGLKIAG